MMSRHRNSNKAVAASKVRKLAATSTLAAGAGLGLFVGAEAQAEVVPFTPPGGPVNISMYGGYHALDINGDSTYDFVIYGNYFGQFEFGDWYRSATGYMGLNRVMNTGSLATVVPSGGTIGPDYSGWLEETTLDLFSGTRGYAGVVFDIPGGSPHFAYLDISIDPNDPSLTLYGGAYESHANTPIQVPVPEPASLVFLASGAMGLAAWRRRRP
jgi:hypothetical protein